MRGCVPTSSWRLLRQRPDVSQAAIYAVMENVQLHFYFLYNNLGRRFSSTARFISVGVFDKEVLEEYGTTAIDDVLSIDKRVEAAEFNNHFYADVISVGIEMGNL